MGAEQQQQQQQQLVEQEIINIGCSGFRSMLVGFSTAWTTKNQYHPPGFSVHRRGGENSPRSDDDDDPIYTGHSTWSAGGYIKIWQPAKGVASVTMQNDLPQTLPKIALPSEAGAAEPLVPPSIDADVLTCTGCCGRTKDKKQETLRTVYI